MNWSCLFVPQMVARGTSNASGEIVNEAEANLWKNRLLETSGSMQVIKLQERKRGSIPSVKVPSKDRVCLSVGSLAGKCISSTNRVSDGMKLSKLPGGFNQLSGR